MGVGARILIGFAASCSVLCSAPPCEGPARLMADAAGGGSSAHAALGYWFAEEGLLDCAIASFKEAVHSEGDSLEARYNLGVALYERGDYESAVEHLQAAIRLDPRNSLVRAALGKALSETGRDQEAEEILLSAMSAGESPSSVALVLAQVQARLGKSDQAIATLENLLRVDPGAETARALLGELRQPPTSLALRGARAFARGDFAEAERALQGIPSRESRERCRAAQPRGFPGENGETL